MQEHSKQVKAEPWNCVGNLQENWWEIEENNQKQNRGRFKLSYMPRLIVGDLTNSFFAAEFLENKFVKKKENIFTIHVTNRI